MIGGGIVSRLFEYGVEMLTGQRVILSDNTVLSDLSRSLGDLFSTNSTLAIVATEDALFLGSDQPFNHRYIKVSTANTSTAAVAVSIWTGSAFTAAVDVIDFTSVGGKTLAASGIIQWTTARTSGWVRVADSADVTGLTGTAIYDMFWTKMTFSANLYASTALAYIGQKFSDDSLLGGYYPDLVRSKLMAAHTSGKTNWDEQHVLAGEELVRDLRVRRYVTSGAQVFDWELFAVPAMHKCANIIMAGLGEDYADRATDAQEAYQSELENTMAGLDRNKDGRLSQEERAPVVGLRRV